MNLFQKIGNAVLGFASGTLLPWLENLLKEVSHDTVDLIVPEIETALTNAGVAATGALKDGDGFHAALDAAVSAIKTAAPAILANTETVTLQDVFTAAAAAVSNQSVAAKAAPPVATDPVT